MSSYIALAGIWVVLASVYAGLALAGRNNSLWAGVVIPLVAAFSSGLWLYGFRLAICDGQLEYRDGLRKSTAVPLAEIRDVRNAWVEWRLLGRQLEGPRLIVTYGAHSNRLVINTKPFRKRDIQLAMDVLRNGIDAACLSVPATSPSGTSAP